MRSISERVSVWLMNNFILFGIGGITYMVIELLWRGCTHWTMMILGGLCFLAAGAVNRIKRIGLPIKMMICAVLITVLEFITGYIVNIKLGMNVWSYYDMNYNVMGQICLTYTIMWFFLSAGCIYADSYLRYNLLGSKT